MADATLGQAKPRKDLVVGAVNPDEKALIEQARLRAEVRNMSVFVRETMLRRAAEIMAAPKASPRRRVLDQVA